MTTTNKCRRCSECKRYSHHWLPNPEFGTEGPRGENDHVCKHCGAEGNTCEHCFGDGIEPGLPEELCGVCGGEGVNQV
jgi:hypothetical protein